MRQLLIFILFIGACLLLSFYSTMHLNLDISAIQGVCDSSVYINKRVSTTGIVTSIIHHNENFYGYFLQEEAILKGQHHSYALFVRDSVYEVNVGDKIHCSGTVEEINGMTCLTSLTNCRVLANNINLKPFSLSIIEANGLERFEGLLICLTDTLVININSALAENRKVYLKLNRRYLPDTISVISSVNDVYEGNEPVHSSFLFNQPVSICFPQSLSDLPEHYQNTSFPTLACHVQGCLYFIDNEFFILPVDVPEIICIDNSFARNDFSF